MLNISNLHKAVIRWTEFMETLKNRLFFYDIIKNVLCITRLIQTNLKLTFTIIHLSDVLMGGQEHAVH